MRNYTKWLAGLLIIQLVTGCSSGGGGGGDSNNVPVATDISSTVVEDTTKAITLAATDANGDTLTYVLVTSPLQGTATLANNVVNYMPKANYSGTDSFTYKANDGKADSNIATVNITVTAVNDVPNVSPISVTLNEDVSTVVTLLGTDLDHEVLTYSVVTAPAHGTVSITGNKATYTPSVNYVGADSFTYKASDGKAISATATVNLTIKAVADAPIANNIQSTTDEDKTVKITLLGSDPDSTKLTYSVVTNATNGSVIIANNIATYIPTKDFNGTDSFTYKVSDGALTSNTSTVNLTINAVNDPPEAHNFATTAISYEATSFDLRGLDVDDVILTRTATITAQPLHGTVTLNGLRVTYKSNVYYKGLDYFKFTLSDGKATSNEAQVTVSIALPSPLSATATGKLNDTGAVTCANTSTSNLSCPITTHPQQDADVGRDVTHNDNTDGKGGFSFTKVDKDGRALPIQDQSWSNTGTEAAGTKWSCVKDNVTGLIWEIKTDDNGLHDKDWVYTWYNSDSTKNGGDAGTQTTALSCGASISCDTESFVNAVNNATWCGANDWRLPTLRDLASLSILESDNNQLLGIDTNFFPDLPLSNRQYWSANSIADFNGMLAHTFDYYYAHNALGSKISDRLYVRLVRGNP